MMSTSPQPSAFLGRVLLVSNDAVALRQLTESAQRFALNAEQCPNVSQALERLNRSKFEAIIVDFQLGSEAGTILECARRSPSNEHAVLFTVSDSEGDTTEAFKAGSTFVLRRPLSAASIDQSLRAAYGLIVRENRRYYRCPVEVPVTMTCRTMPAVDGQTVNVSEGGMAVNTSASFRPSDGVNLQFSLPYDDCRFELEATICWVKEGRVGLQFSASPQISKLQEWLARRLEETMPQSVKDKFADSPVRQVPS
jgi:DNA-binding response OmpR family regulator